MKIPDLAFVPGALSRMEGPIAACVDRMNNSAHRVRGISLTPWETGAVGIGLVPYQAQVGGRAVERAEALASELEEIGGNFMFTDRNYRMCEGAQDTQSPGGVSGGLEDAQSPGGVSGGSAEDDFDDRRNERVREFLLGDRTAFIWACVISAIALEMIGERRERLAGGNPMKRGWGILGTLASWISSPKDIRHVSDAWEPSDDVDVVLESMTALRESVAADSIWEGAAKAECLERLDSVVGELSAISEGHHRMNEVFDHLATLYHVAAKAARALAIMLYGFALTYSFMVAASGGALLNPTQGLAWQRTHPIISRIANGISAVDLKLRNAIHLAIALMASNALLLLSTEAH